MRQAANLLTYAFVFVVVVVQFCIDRVSLYISLFSLYTNLFR